MPKLQFLRNSTQNLSHIRNFRETAHKNNPGWFDKVRYKGKVLFCCMIKQRYYNVFIYSTYLKGQFQSCNQLQGIGKQLDSRSPGKEIYELIFEDVKPEYWKKYIEHQGEIIA